MSDEQMYEAEIRVDGGDAGQGWNFVGNFAVIDWGLGSSFEQVARAFGWEPGDYRLSHLDDSGVSGSFYLYSLTVRSDPVYEAAPTAAKGVEAVA